jgi:hypothetical protein
MLCVVDKGNGSLIVDTTHVAPNCLFEALTPAEYDNLLAASSSSSQAALYAQYFDFDLGLFSTVLVACLTVYAIGHTIGAVWKWLSKTN